MDLEKDPLNFLILGRKGSGKSVTGWSILQKQCEAGKKAYFFQCPKPELLETLPFKVTNVLHLSELFHITDGVVLIDEANIHFDVMSKTVNDDLRKILQLSRQCNTSFIFVVHNSYVFNRSLFCYLDVKIIKELNEQHWELERIHMKKLYRDARVTGKAMMFIDCDAIRGYAKNDVPTWYNDNFSTMYRKTQEVKTLFKSASKCEEVLDDTIITSSEEVQL